MRIIRFFESLLDTEESLIHNMESIDLNSPEITNTSFVTTENLLDLEVSIETFNNQGVTNASFVPIDLQTDNLLDLEGSMESLELNNQGPNESFAITEDLNTNSDSIAPASILETCDISTFDDSSLIHPSNLNEDSLHVNSQDHVMEGKQESQLSPEEAYATKVQTFLKARNLKGEFSKMERTKSRGRPQSSSRLYEKTKSFEVKCEMRKAQEELIQSFQQKRSQSVGVRSRPTTPQSPKLRTSSRANRETATTKLTSEELLFQAVQEQKKIQEQIMKKHQSMFENLKNKRNSTIPVTARSTKELTIPMTPYSHVDNRLGKREVVIVQEEKKEIKQKKLGPTHVQPFNFSTDARASLRGDASTPSAEGITAGEILAKFHRDPRSHDVPKINSHAVTRPISPKLRTSSRSDAAYGRPKPPSRVEQEEAEFLAAQAHAFKAKPVDKRIFQSMGDLGVPKVQPKEVTQPEEFHLASSQRAAYRSSLSQSQQVKEEFHFKARKMPSFEEDPRANIHHEVKVTEAHSPKLHGSTRASSAPARRQRLPHQIVEKMKKDAIEKAKKESKQPLKLTEPEGFELLTSKRGLAAKAALEARINREKEQEKAQNEIHARPFPEKIFKETFYPAPSTKPLTEIEEFHLATEERILKSSLHRTEDSQSKENTENNFHARPVPKSTYQPTFSVEPSHREPLIPKDVNLQSSLRAIQRKSFDDTVHQHQEEIAKQKELNELKREQELQKELKRLRSKSIEEGGYAFKASPVLQEDPFPTKHVEPHKLTEPVSPKLRTALRVRNHS